MKFCDIFGHNFKARYSTFSNSVNESQHDLIDQMLRTINNSDIPRIMKAMNGCTETYHGDVCKNCGMVVNCQDK